MSDFNKVIMMGRLTRDPTQDGDDKPCKFGIANNRYKDKTTFINCVVWGKRSSTVMAHFQKGQQILVEGELEQNKWEDKNGNKRESFSIVVSDFKFIGSKNEQQKEEAVPF